MEALFYKSNPWWEEPFVLNAIQRDVYLNELEGYIDNKDIIFLTGLRRVGKTTLLKGIVNLLLHVKKIEPKHIFYISLDLYDLERLSIADIVTEYRKLHKLPNFQNDLSLFR